MKIAIDTGIGLPNKCRGKLAALIHHLSHRLWSDADLNKQLLDLLKSAPSIELPFDPNLWLGEYSKWKDGVDAFLKQKGIQ